MESFNKTDKKSIIHEIYEEHVFPYKLENNQGIIQLKKNRIKSLFLKRLQKSMRATIIIGIIGLIIMLFIYYPVPTMFILLIYEWLR